MRYKVGATLCALIECLSIGGWGEGGRRRLRVLMRRAKEEWGL